MKKEQMYLEVINSICDGVYFVDLERRITFWNHAAEEITGYTAEEVIGRRCNDNLLNHIDSEGRPLCIVGCPLYASMIDEQQRKAEVFLRHKKGHRVPISVNIFPLKDEGKVIGAIEVFTQCSPIVYDDNLVEELSSIAMHDALTGLPNRRYLESFIEYQIHEYLCFNKLFALLFMDIDNFRSFNNTYGHDIGDDVLKNITESISRTTRKTDLFGRWGGEEFLGAYCVKDEYEASIIAEKVRVLVANTEIPYKEPLSVTVSIGITLVQNGDTIDSIVERADALMYKSKENGKNRITMG